MELHSEILSWATGKLTDPLFVIYQERYESRTPKSQHNLSLLIKFLCTQMVETYAKMNGLNEFGNLKTGDATSVEDLHNVDTKNPYCKYCHATGHFLTSCKLRRQVCLALCILYSRIWTYHLFPDTLLQMLFYGTRSKILQKLSHSTRRSDLLVWHMHGASLASLMHQGHGFHR